MHAASLVLLFVAFVLLLACTSARLEVNGRTFLYCGWLATPFPEEETPEIASDPTLDGYRQTEDFPVPSGGFTVDVDFSVSRGR